MVLTFKDGYISGEGKDNIDRFSISGSYSPETGECKFTKWYDRPFFDLSTAPVSYRGFNQGRFIWGTWDITTPNEHADGGFKIWPEGYSGGGDAVAEQDIEEPVEAPESRRLELVQV